MDMSRALLTITGLLAILAAGACSPVDERSGGLLVTEEQLRTLEALPEDEEISRGEPEPGAPRILVSTPGLGAEVTTPVPVRIRFVAEPDAEIRPDTLRVRYGPIDVTDKVLENLEVSPAGIDGRIDDALPGKYKFKVSISDTRNRTGEANLKFRVIAGR
jgi:hypothetical protein